MYRSIMAGAFLLLAAGMPAAKGDAVRVMRGDNSWGQGWMFLDTDGTCKLLTAGHVVRGLDGHYLAPVVQDGRGRSFTTGEPLVLSVTPDIAVLPLPGVTGAENCGTGRLSDIGAVRRAANLAHPMILTTGKSEIDQVSVERRASAMDAGDGSVFAVRPVDPKDTVKEGWSGSPVVDDGGLIGVVFQVDAKRNEAAAIRVDIARKLMREAAVPSETAHPDAALLSGMTVYAGQTPDASRAAAQLLHAGSEGWLVNPAGNSIVFSAVLSKPMAIHNVSLTTVPGAALAGVEIATKADNADESWVSAAYCTPNRATPIRTGCVFSPRTVTAIRLALRLHATTQIVIRDLTIR